MLTPEEQIEASYKPNPGELLAMTPEEFKKYIDTLELKELFALGDNITAHIEDMNIPEEEIERKIGKDLTMSMLVLIHRGFNDLSNKS
jgi:hypothetical protein